MGTGKRLTKRVEHAAAPPVRSLLRKESVVEGTSSDGFHIFGMTLAIPTQKEQARVVPEAG